MGDLNGAGTDPADDIIQQAVFDFVLGKPAQYGEVPEQQAPQSQHRASDRDKQEEVFEKALVSLLLP